VSRHEPNLTGAIKMEGASVDGKGVRRYLMIGIALLVFTALTVGANRFHFVVPVAITVALIIAITKGSMVAAVFMHLSHERRWIYGALVLTVVFFVVLLFIPLFTTLDNIGSLSEAARAAVEHSGH
jgi:caa(3)-type oxidase subunit IV